MITVAESHVKIKIGDSFGPKQSQPARSSEQQNPDSFAIARNDGLGGSQ